MNRGTGLNVVKKDKRDFSYKKAKLKFGAPPLHDNDFIIEPPFGIKDQGDTSCCTAFAVTALREDTEKVRLSEEFQYALTKKIEGSWTTYGASQYDALRAATKGALEKSLSPFSLEKDPQAVFANWNNWPQNLIDAGYIHKGGSFFEVDGSGDLFDNIRTVLQLEKRAIFAGLHWQPDWGQAILPEYAGTMDKSLANAHAVDIRGQKKINGQVHLVLHNSWGEDNGDKGYYYIPRSWVNKLLFAFCILDDDPNQVKRDTWTLFQKILDWLQKVLASLSTTPQPNPIIPIEDNIPPPVTPPAPPTPISPPTPLPSKIETWADAIKTEEGFYPGSRSYRNQNPGNIKYSAYSESLGARAKDIDGFCIFNSYKSGYDALCQLLKDAASNRLSKYHDVDLKTFTQIYANPPSDKYAENVAKKLGVNVGDKIKTFL